jgi:hypothetical protein
MLGYRGPAQPSPTLGDALNAGYLYLEVRCLGCDTQQTVALDIVRRPKATPSTSWSGTCDVGTVRRLSVKRSHLVALAAPMSTSEVEELIALIDVRFKTPTPSRRGTVIVASSAMLLRFTLAIQYLGISEAAGIHAGAANQDCRFPASTPFSMRSTL